MIVNVSDYIISWCDNQGVMWCLSLPYLSSEWHIMLSSTQSPGEVVCCLDFTPKETNLIQLYLLLHLSIRSHTNLRISLREAILPSTIFWMISSWSSDARCSLPTRATHEELSQHFLPDWVIQGWCTILLRLIRSFGSRLSIEDMRLQ